jgi:hypothetical protein
MSLLQAYLKTEFSFSLHFCSCLSCISSWYHDARWYNETHRI